MKIIKQEPQWSRIRPLEATKMGVVQSLSTALRCFFETIEDFRTLTAAEQQIELIWKKMSSNITA